jgi:type I restriction enzyme, S subunit
MLAFSTMSTRASLNNEMIGHLKISYPSTPEQKAIGLTLKMLDDWIELNRRMNETLEGMAQALFKSWFVDFDPVIDNAMTSGKEVPEELGERAAARVALCEKRKPLPADIRALFPDEFTLTDELGWIPKGWEVGTLAKVCFVKGGYAFKSKDFTTSGFPVIKIKNINSDKTINVKDVQFIPEKIAETAESFWLSSGDLLMAMTGATIGKFGLLVPEIDKTYLLNQRVAKFCSLEDVSKHLWFVYCGINQQNISDYIVNVAHGSAQANISASAIMSSRIIKPSDEVIRKFDSVVDANFSKMLKNRETEQTLSTLRDTLLPKLLSGELRIADAQKFAAEAGL